MRRSFTLVMTLAVCLIGSAVSADIELFKGDPIRVAGLTLSGWGSGTAMEASDKVFTGTRCIKIVSQGLHEGGCLIYKNPIEIISGTVDDSDYLQFILGFTQMVREGTNTPVGPGVPGGLSGGPSPRGSYYSGSQEFEIPSRPKVNEIRVVLQSDDGRTVEVTQDVPTARDEGWYKIAIPFKVLGLKQGESFRVTRILIFTDVPDTIFLGQISTMKDDTPITVYAGEDQVVAIYDTVTIRAEAEGGANMLRYSWNFGDRDPDGEDASGIMMSHKYTRGGDFTITLTVSDLWGIKKPAVKKIKITVND